jgi:hypothetical protein
MVGHKIHLEWQWRRKQSTRRGSLKCRAPYWRVQLIPSAPIAHLLMQIRHNLVVPEKPFFRRGCCVLKTAHHFEESGTEAETLGFREELAFGKNWLSARISFRQELAFGKNWLSG